LLPRCNGLPGHSDILLLRHATESSQHGEAHPPRTQNRATRRRYADAGIAQRRERRYG
jgi:hypothetical protein